MRVDEGEIVGGFARAYCTSPSRARLSPRLEYTDGRVHGIATNVGVDAVPFTIDALAGEVEGGFEGWGIVGT